ncbi:hypothetical protein SH449x_005304 [Pirellulaceae bacterium SH449]
MSAATLTAPQYVQTQFRWDEDRVVTVKENTVNLAPERQSAVSCPPRTIPNGSETVQTSARNPKQRSGGCVHVGAPLVSVLNKYGFSLDDLLVEIERQKMAVVK